MYDKGRAMKDAGIIETGNGSSFITGDGTENTAG
jgi:hypothetical protein